jgi:hypothetical protein
MGISSNRHRLSFFTTRSISRTANHFRQVFREESFISSRFALKATVVQFGLMTICLAAFALRTPESIIEVGQQFGIATEVADTGRAAAMSIGVACLGATAHAAKRALNKHAANWAD